MACANTASADNGGSGGGSAAKEGDGMAAKAAAGRPRRERTENAAKRRRQLIEATIDSIVEHGLSATTLATVSDGAGLSQGVAVFYFQHKQALLAATMKYHYQEYHKVWRSALAEAPADPVAANAALVGAGTHERSATPHGRGEGRESGG